MNVRLFNDNGGETLTPEGHSYSEMVGNALKPIVQWAVFHNISLRDLQTVVVDEIRVLTAEELVRRGINERKAAREALKTNHVEAAAQALDQK